MNNHKFRLFILYIFLFICISRLIFELFSLQVFQSQFLISQNNLRALRKMKLVGELGTIYDRNEEILAVSVPIKTIIVNGQDFQTTYKQLSSLSLILEMDQKYLEEFFIQNKNKKFSYIKRNVSPDIAKQVEELKIPGIYSLNEYKRFYPKGALLSQLIGFYGYSENGSYGLELSLYKQLQKDSVSINYLKNAKSKVADIDNKIGVYSENDVHLSIDIRLQQIAFESLKESISKHNASYGSAVVIDITTGEILAVTNYPSFNPNILKERISENVRNRAMQDYFEPGSTIKAFSIASALISERWNIKSTVDTYPGELKIGKYTIKDVSSYSGILSLTDVLVKSSNVGISKIAFDIGGDVIYKTLNDFGFGKHIDLGFVLRNTGKLPNYKIWSPVHSASLSYGYGLSTSLLQLAYSYSTLANDGYKTDLSLFKKKSNSQKVSIINSKVSKTVLGMLQKAVENTSNFKIKNYVAAGKSGTTRVVKNGIYQDDIHNSFFVGVAPLNKPKLSVAVFIAEPKNKYYGSQVAGPVFANIIEESLQILNIAPDK